MFHDLRDDSLIVSARHQDVVIKFSRTTGKLAWILGNHANWSSEFRPFLLHPVGPVAWQYHQHAAMVTRSGTILVFDNNNFGAPAYASEIGDANSSSGAIEYAVDEDQMEVSQVWEYHEPWDDRLYASFLCDVDELPSTGNVLIHIGAVERQGGELTDPLGLGTGHIRIIEVTHDHPAQKVFDVRIHSPDGMISSYRAERIPSLYPQY